MAHWKKAAAKKYPDGLPEPESDDPTQWLFHGRPDEAQEGTEPRSPPRGCWLPLAGGTDEKMRLSKGGRWSRSAENWPSSRTTTASSASRRSVGKNPRPSGC